MYNKIMDIRSAIFENKTDTAIKDTLDLIGKVSIDLSNRMDINNKRQLFNEIINLINIAIENKDYLLLVDVLKYELQAFIHEIDACG